MTYITIVLFCYSFYTFYSVAVNKFIAFGCLQFAVLKIRSSCAVIPYVDYNIVCIRLLNCKLNFFVIGILRCLESVFKNIIK